MELNDKALVWRLGLVGLISAADNWIVSPILPVIAGVFSTTAAQAGIVLTAYLIPYGLMQPVYGFIGDRWGKAAILRWITGGLAFGTLGCAFAGSLLQLLAWRFLTGFFAAGIIAVSLALIGDAVPLERRHRSVGRFMGMVFLGQGMSVGLGGILAEYVNWRAVFAIFAAGAFLMIWMLRRLPSGLANSAQRNFFTEVRHAILNKTGRIIFPLALATGFLLLGIYSYLGAFLHFVSRLEYFQIGLIMMFFGLACLTAGNLVAKVVRYSGVGRTILLGGILALVSAVLLSVSSDWRIVWTATVLLGFGYIFIQSTLATMAFDVAAESKGLPSALIGVGLFGGGGGGCAFGGWILQSYDYRILWMVFAAGMLLLVLTIASLNFRSLKNSR